MFDANAAYIQIGKEFFAEVHDARGMLGGFGVSEGDVLICEHLSKKDRRWDVVSKVTKSDGTTFVWEDRDSVDDWLVYSGNLDGSGFIDEDIKAKALAFLNGEWIDL